MRYNWFSFQKNQTKVQGNQLRIAIIGIGMFFEIVMCFHKPCVVLGLYKLDFLAQIFICQYI